MTGKMEGFFLDFFRIFDSGQVFFGGGLNCFFFFWGGGGQNNLKIRGSALVASSMNNVQPNKVRHSMLFGIF